MRRSQGTISILLGCHSLIHSILVLISWIKLYKLFPKWWQLICIFIHDIGHLNKAYLDDYEEKKKHWILGAKIAKLLFGTKGYDFIAGHCVRNNNKRSPLYKPDKYSWYIAPIWWIYLNNIFEPKLMGNMTSWEATLDFKKQIRESIENDIYRPSHDMYLYRTKKKEQNIDAF